MRCAVLLVVLALALPVLGQTTRPEKAVPQTPGIHRMDAVPLTVGKKTEKIPYVLYLPKTYSASGAKTPVLLFLHGLGESGLDLDAIFLHGPMFELVKKDVPQFTDRFPMAVISPQCPPRGQRWDRDSMNGFANALLDEVLPKLNVDLDRVYATGLSMGGLGTWRVAIERPDRYAAIAPISALPVGAASDFMWIGRLHALAITGEGDEQQIAGSKQMMAEINQAGGHARVVMGPGGHGVWIQAYGTPRTYEWLLMQKRGVATPTTQPTPTVQSGIQHIALWSPKRGQIDVIVRMPRISSSRLLPLLLIFPDPQQFGVYRAGYPLHGPLLEAEGNPKSAANNFILAEAMPPIFVSMDGGERRRILEQLVSICKADPSKSQMLRSNANFADEELYANVLKKGESADKKE